MNNWKPKVMDRLGSPILTISLLAGFLWLAWYSQRPTEQEQLSALIQRSLAEAARHDALVAKPVKHKMTKAEQAEVILDLYAEAN